MKRSFTVLMRNNTNEKMKVALIDVGYDRVDLNEPLGITVLYDYTHRFAISKITLLKNF